MICIHHDKGVINAAQLRPQNKHDINDTLRQNWPGSDMSACGLYSLIRLKQVELRQG